MKKQERQKCEIWTRVMGYHRPVASFNIGKKSEHKERKHFSEIAVVNAGFCGKY
jgi:anaerobic ribonucleoside-triphosphate reductase